MCGCVETHGADAWGVAQRTIQERLWRLRESWQNRWTRSAERRRLGAPAFWTLHVFRALTIGGYRNVSAEWPCCVSRIEPSDEEELRGDG